MSVQQQYDLSGRVAFVTGASSGLGAQFAQMVKELRSEYFAAITLCAEKLAHTLATQQPTSVILILRHHGLKAQATQTQGAVSRGGAAVGCELRKQWLL